MKTQIDYITPLKKQLDEKMHEVCTLFMLIGVPHETPRYYNLDEKTFYNNKDFDGFLHKNFIIYIGSTQTNKLFFEVKCETDYFENLRLNTREFWAQFKEYRTNFLIENYPTINPY